MTAKVATEAAIDTWPMLRAAVASVAAQHWRALRRIAPAADPRFVAAETVASQACHLVQSPVLWEALHLLGMVVGSNRPAVGHSTLTGAQLAQLNRQLEALDHAAAAWAGSAYGQLPGRVALTPSNEP